jgi:hypothetical protein
VSGVRVNRRKLLALGGVAAFEGACVHSESARSPPKSGDSRRRSCSPTAVTQQRSRARSAKSSSRAGDEAESAFHISNQRASVENRIIVGQAELSSDGAAEALRLFIRLANKELGHRSPHVIDGRKHRDDALVTISMESQAIEAINR